MDIQARIRTKYGFDLDEFERLGILVHELVKANEARMFVGGTRAASTSAVVSLFARARKAYPAIYLLASRGFGEDAMILARSLTNLCIDLGYIACEDSEVRARQWLAVGRVSRRDLAKEAGWQPPDEGRIDWDAEKTLANKWKGMSIRGRAERAKLDHFYQRAYRYGSVFEHSDAYGVSGFLEKVVEDGVVVNPNPSDRLVDTALLAGEIAFAQTAELAPIRK